MARYAVKERLHLVVVTYVDAHSRLEAVDLVTDMDIFDYDRIIETDIEILGVTEAESEEDL
jgi:hypothetical protein